MVPRLNELIEIAELLNHSSDNMDYSRMTICFDVPEAMLTKLNEDIYYRNNTEGKPQENVDEINLNIQGIKFRYQKESRGD